MNLADLAIRNKTTTLVLTAVMIVAGLASYNSMGRLEDPEFTIKDALVSSVSHSKFSLVWYIRMNSISVQGIRNSWKMAIGIFVVSPPDSQPPAAIRR